MRSAPMQDDIVETFLAAHAQARSTLALAERLTNAQADASTANMAQRVVDSFQWHLEVHFDDEERTLAPRLRGRHRVLDETMAVMRLEHVQLSALIARVRFLCSLVAKDPQRLLSLRFSLADVVDQLRRSLEAHQAREESLLFPAVKRLLDWQDVEEMRQEMGLRRAPGVELSEAGA